jgi:hypothetical protein
MPPDAPARVAQALPMRAPPGAGRPYPVFFDQPT